MTNVERWLLPEGVEELLPEQAAQAEFLRRQLLDLYHRWGYDLVIPPLIEFTDSLLVGQGRDVDLNTFKVVDQISGRTLGVRADITPQVARIDAHCLRQQGATRLCYAGSVLHTRPIGLMASRSPIQLGAELYGDASIASDVEVISLMLETLRVAGIETITLDLGHVGIYRSLVANAGIDQPTQQQLFDALQRKAEAEVLTLVRDKVADPNSQDMLIGLMDLMGSIAVLDDARLLLATASRDVHDAINQLAKVAAVIQQRMPDVTLYFDLSELRGYHYHTGIVFAALAPGLGRAVANGGRYDDIGKAFGRARPATGFNIDLKALINLLPQQAEALKAAEKAAIWSPAIEDTALWHKVQQLREQGEQVITELNITGSNKEQPNYQQLNCDRYLQLELGEWQVKNVND